MSNIKIENINLVQAESLIQQAIDSLVEANRFRPAIPNSTEVLIKLTEMRDLLIKEII